MSPHFACLHTCFVCGLYSDNLATDRNFSVGAYTEREYLARCGHERLCVCVRGCVHAYVNTCIANGQEVQKHMLVAHLWKSINIGKWVTFSAITFLLACMLDGTIFT